MATRETDGARLMARDGRGTQIAALVSRVSRLRRSRARALPLLNRKKKRDCQQSSKNIAKNDSAFFQTCRVYLDPPHLSNVSDVSSSRIPKDFIQVQKENGKLVVVYLGHP